MKKLKISSLTAIQALSQNDKAIVNTLSGMQQASIALIKKELFKNADVSDIIDLFNPIFWEAGYWLVTNGTAQNDPNFTRCKDWVLVRPGKTYKLTEPTGKVFQIIHQNVDGTYGALLASKNGTGDLTFTTPNTTRAIKIYVNVPFDQLSSLSISLKEI